MSLKEIAKESNKVKGGGKTTAQYDVTKSLT